MLDQQVKDLIAIKIGVLIGQIAELINISTAKAANEVIKLGPEGFVHTYERTMEVYNMESPNVRFGSFTIKTDDAVKNQRDEVKKEVEIWFEKLRDIYQIKEKV